MGGGSYLADPPGGAGGATGRRADLAAPAAVGAVTEAVAPAEQDQTDALVLAGVAAARRQQQLQALRLSASACSNDYPYSIAALRPGFSIAETLYAKSWIC